LDIADVTGVDWVEGMIAAHQERVRLQDLNSRLHYACVDITQKSMETGAYDVVIEKALIDSLISHPEAKELLPKALKNISQSMKEGGYFVCVSSAVGIDRVALFDRKDCNWKTLHLSELAADKDPETKINLIIVRKYTQDELKALAETPAPSAASSESSSSTPSAPTSSSS
jgi:tRNA1(Val) A37 N6-methylase TrmN6